LLCYYYDVCNLPDRRLMSVEIVGGSAMTQRKKSQNIGSLMIVVFSAVFLWALTAVVWPVPVVYAGDPTIITITVTSSLETYFYDPGLEEEGGTVYFNNLIGEGGGQVITVTTTVSGSMPITLTGATAFGMTPISDTNSSGELGITYTIGTSAGTENGVLFTVTDSDGLTDTALITFTQDITEPTIISPTLNELSPFLHADGSMLYYGDEVALFWVEGEAQDDGAGPFQATYSDAFESAPQDDDLIPPLYSWEGYYAVAAETDYGNGTITVTVSDQVGNSATQIFTYTRDTDSPDISYGSPPIVEDSPYLYAPYPDGTTVYYSHQMGGTAQSFTVQGSATDNDGGAGLDRATFSSPHLNDPGDDLTFPDWSGTYYVDSSDSGSGTITVTVYDNVSNWSEKTFNYIEDTTNPTVSLTYVTPGSYDEDDPEDWLDADSSNWYNAGDFTAGGGDDWQFTSYTDDDGAGLSSCTAVWDHSTNQSDRTLPCGPGGDGTFLGISSDDDGTVTVTVTLTDYVGNSASDTVLFNIDNTKPTITSPYISEDSDYLYRADDLITVYYGNITLETFTVHGSSDDTGVGLDRAEFSDAFGAAPSDDDTPDAWEGTYYPNDNQNWGSDTITVTVYDRLENYDYENFYYISDTVPPGVDVDCPAVSSDPSWSVSWTGSDSPPASGLKHFDVQYKVEESGGWQDWHTNTSLIEDTFGPTFPIPVQDNTTYCFKVRAKDNVSNVSSYTTGEDCTTYSSGIKKVFLPKLMAPEPNWGFETGDFTSWQQYGQLEQSVSTAMPHSGNYSALLGSPGYPCYGVPVGSAWLRRWVTVPSSGSPTLSFYYRIFTQDKTAPAYYDKLDLFAVYINDYINDSQLVVEDANITYPPTCAQIYDLCSDDWCYVSFSLDAYKGQRIEITFYNYNRADPPANYPERYNTYTYIDDVSVK
jgi:hypothetical protein